MEVEAKFRADSDTFRRLRAAEELAGYRLTPPADTDLVDVYLDTDGDALRTAGFAFRERRSGGAESLYTLKALPQGERSVLEREETEQSLPAQTSPEDWPPGPLRDAVLELTGGEPVHPLLEVRQDRGIRRLLDADGTEVAELCLDDIRLSTPGGIVHHAIVEVELADGAPRAVIDAVTRVLAGDWGLSSETRSKFQLALEAAGRLPDPPKAAEGKRTTLPKTPGLQPDDSMARAAQKTLAFHFARLESHEEGTREGADIEELHDMRVAARRMRAALRIFADYLDPDDVRPLLRGLRKTGRALGAVRDLDVAGERVRAFQEGLPPSDAAGAEGLLRAWAAERGRARAKLVGYLDGRQYGAWKAETRAFLERELDQQGLLDRRGEPRPYRLRHVVPTAAYVRYGEMLAFDEWVAGEPATFERLHQLRIAAKGFRYCLEFFREVLGPEARPLIGELKELQDHLGELHDAVVDSDVLAGLLHGRSWGGRKTKRAAFAPAEEAAIALFQEQRQAQRDELVRTFPELWVTFRRADFAGGLAAAVTALSD